MVKNDLKFKTFEEIYIKGSEALDTHRFLLHQLNLPPPISNSHHQDYRMFLPGDLYKPLLATIKSTSPLQVDLSLQLVTCTHDTLT